MIGLYPLNSFGSNYQMPIKRGNKVELWVSNDLFTYSFWPPAEAEAERLDTYTISVASTWYDIKYGPIKGSGGSGKGVAR